MALSEKEKDWLERREKYPKLYCQHCQFFEPYDTPHVNPGWCSGDCWCCPVVGKDILYSFQDAAEFEALVAVKLAQNEYIFIPCYLSGTKWDDCPHKDWDCNQCRIKYARLAVEQEMDDADRK